MPNPYVDLFLEESYRNQIYAVSRKDEHDKIKNNVTTDYPVFNGFLDFSRDNLKLSPQDIIKYANSNDVIAQFLYSSYFQDNARTQEWIEFFTPVLKSDFNLFEECLSQCLLMHINNKIYVENSTDNYRQYHIENNERNFHNLIQIGKNSHFFNSITQEKLFTENKDYQLYLEKENLFHSNFTVEKLIEECFLGEENRLRKYLSSVTEEMMQALIEKPEIIEQIFNPQEEIKSKGYNSKTPNNFLNILFKNNFTIDKSIYENFLSVFLQNKTIKKQMLDSNRTVLILNNYPDLLIPFLETLTKTQKDYFYRENNFDYSEYRGIGVIKHIYNVMSDSKTTNKIYSMEVIDYIYKNLLDNCALDPNVLDMETIGKRQSLNSTMRNCILKCGSSNNNLNHTNNILFTRQNLDKYSFIISDNFKLNEDKTYDRLKQLKMIFNKIDVQTQEKIIDKLSVKIQDELFHTFKLQDEPGNIAKAQTSYDINRYNYTLSNLILFIQYFDKPDVLDVLRPDPNKPRWAEILLDVSETIKNNKTKFYENIPLSFYLIQSSKGSLLSWFSQEENLPHLANLTYKSKKIMNYYKSDKDFFSTLVKEVVVDSEKFNLLLEKVKPALEAAKQLEDTDIKNAISYYELSNKVDKSVKNVPMKILPKKKI